MGRPAHLTASVSWRSSLGLASVWPQTTQCLPRASSPDSLCQLAALIVAHVAWRRAHQAGHAVLLHVLAHVQPHLPATVTVRLTGRQVDRLPLEAARLPSALGRFLCDCREPVNCGACQACQVACGSGLVGISHRPQLPELGVSAEPVHHGFICISMTMHEPSARSPKRTMAPSVVHRCMDLRSVLGQCTRQDKRLHHGSICISADVHESAGFPRRTMAPSVLNRRMARARASSVLPKPMWPRNMKLAMGLRFRV